MSSFEVFLKTPSLRGYRATVASALCMSGTYNLQKHVEGDWSDDLYYASPAPDAGAEDDFEFAGHGGSGDAECLC